MCLYNNTRRCWTSLILHFILFVCLFCCTYWLFYLSLFQTKVKSNPIQSSTCFQQWELPVWVPLAGAPMCHSGFFGTVFRARWARGGAPQCIATLGRNGLCGTQSGAFGLQGAAQYLKGQEMGRGIALKQEALPTFRHLMRGLIKREALCLQHQNRSVKTTHWMVICLQVFRSPTCLNAGDAGGVEHPLHLSGAHRNCPQRPQLRRGEIHLVI